MFRVAAVNTAIKQHFPPSIAPKLSSRAAFIIRMRERFMRMNVNDTKTRLFSAPTSKERKS